MYSDLQNLGYNPYVPEFSQLIREGKASRAYWKIMGPIVNFIIRHRVLMGRNVTSALKWLDLSPADLKITHRAARSSKAVQTHAEADSLLTVV
jgi:hypothetical protein